MVRREAKKKTKVIREEFWRCLAMAYNENSLSIGTGSVLTKLFYHKSVIGFLG